MLRPALAAGLLVAVLPTSLLATGLSLRNEAALSRFAALPVLGEPNGVAPGQHRGRYALDLTNEFYVVTQTREQVDLDGETLALTLDHRWGFTGGWEAGLRLRGLRQGGGMLDRFIEDWHGFFGLPNAGRENRPQNRYRYRIERDGETLLLRDQGSSGLGDAELLLGRTAGAGMLRAALKLPTGDAEQLSGGSLGLALWTDQALPFDASGPVGGWASAGASVQQRKGPLRDRQRGVSGFAGAGVEIRALERWFVLGQFYLHTPLYRDLDSDIADPGLQLGLGLRWQASPAWAFDLAFQEDLIVNASPDFSLHAGLRYRPLSGTRQR